MHTQTFSNLMKQWNLNEKRNSDNELIKQILGVSFRNHVLKTRIQ